MKTRICFVIPSLSVGGTERQLMYLIEGLADRYEITVICTRAEGEWAEDARKFGKVIALNTSGGWDLRIKPRLRKFFREHKPAIVHSYMFGFDHAVNVAARAEGVPVVISSRRQVATWKKPRHIRMQKRGNALVDAIVCNSRVVAEFASTQEDQSIDEYTIIHNGIDINAYASEVDVPAIRDQFEIPVGKKLVGIVANFSPVKDHALFIAMAGILRERHNDIHFVIAGSGPLFGDIRARVDLMGMSDAVSILSDVVDVREVYRMLDVCVLTSKAEGFPNVIMEALASGTATVAANVGGIPELITDGETGRLIDTRNPEDFAGAVENYLDNPGEARAAGERGQAFVRKNLSLATMIESHVNLYADLLRAKGVD